jgi:uncharacterized protein HemX
MGALAALRTVWAFRFTIAIGLALAVGGWMLWKMERLKAETKAAEEAFTKAAEINSELAKSFERLDVAKQESEAALTHKLARKSKEADRLGKLVEHVMAQEKSNACATSPAVRAVLDSMRPVGPRNDIGGTNP